MSIQIEAVGLSKQYENKRAVNRVSFKVESGECFGLLGPNGAGKTSTFKMIYGSSRVTEGDLFVAGMSVKTHTKKIKSILGVVPQENGLDPDFSVIDNLLVYGSYFGQKRSAIERRSRELLRMMHLEEYADKPVENLSGGMKRRLTIARSLLMDPQVILLDEPTTGLDPQARQWIWDELLRLKRNGKTLVLTTHYMEEAEVLCDRILMMNKGEVVGTGTPRQLIDQYIGREVVEFEVAPNDMEYHLQKIKDLYPYRASHNRIQLHIREAVDIKEVLNHVAQTKVTVRKASLNDVFLKIAGYELID